MLQKYLSYVGLILILDPIGKYTTIKRINKKNWVTLLKVCLPHDLKIFLSKGVSGRNNFDNNLFIERPSVSLELAFLQTDFFSGRHDSYCFTFIIFSTGCSLLWCIYLKSWRKSWARGVLPSRSLQPFTGRLP